MLTTGKRAVCAHGAKTNESTPAMRAIVQHEYSHGTIDLRIEHKTRANLPTAADARPNKTKLTGPPPLALAKWKARTGGSG